MQRTTRRIAIASQKGGVGKTTTAWNVAAGLTAKGRNVLVVDLDGQCHLTTGVLGAPPERSLWDVLTGSMTAEEAIVPGPEFALLSASEMLSRADYDLGGRPGRDFLLSRARLTASFTGSDSAWNELDRALAHWTRHMRADVPVPQPTGFVQFGEQQRCDSDRGKLFRCLFQADAA